MEVLLIVAICAVLAALVAGAVGFGRKRLARDVARADIWARFEAVVAEVQGLTLVTTDEGHPRLTALIDGVYVEIDYENYVDSTHQTLLGMRCDLVEAAQAPNAALWIGEVVALRSQFGRPRPLGDGNGLFDVYTRAAASASDWWQEPDLHEALAGLRGAGVTLIEGRLTVTFSELDTDSVRSALQIPSLIRRGVERVTIH